MSAAVAHRAVWARRRRTATYRAAAIGLAVLTTALAGCSGIPARSPVAPGLEVGAPGYEIPQVQLRPPAPGASPAEIIAGFLDAASSPEDDYAAARAYLTGTAESSWTPSAQVTVYPDTEQIKPQVSDDGAILRVPVTARLDDTGRYLVASAGEVSTENIGLSKVDGEWRISTLPDGFGLWLDSEWFSYLYRRSWVSYVDPYDRTLVRDPRWISSGRSGPTALGEAQLDPVPAYLRGAAVTGFPNGTGLGVKSIPVADGIAQVELTEQVKNATADQRKAAWAQMLWTMRRWPGVRAVAMTVDGDPLPMFDDTGQPMNLTELPTSLAALGYSENDVTLTSVVQRQGEYLAAQDFTGWLRGGENQRAVESTLPSVPRAWGHTALGPDLSGAGRHVVAVDASRTRVWRWTPQHTGAVPAFGRDLTEPAVDKRSRAWIGGVDSGGASRIWTVPQHAGIEVAPQPIEAGWLEGKVVAVKPSPGGRRLAVATTDAKGVTSVYVTGITLGQGRVPVALAAPWRVATGLTQMQDLAWVDDASLAVLGARDGGKPVPAIVPLGAAMTPLEPVEGAAQIIGAGNEGNVLVITDGGVVWRRSGASSWRRQADTNEVIIPGL